MKERLHPILSCEEAAEFEENLLPDEDASWEAMTRAGGALGEQLLLDLQEGGPLPETASILVLLNKGNNSGDACIAVETLLEESPDLEVEVVSLVEANEMRPLARRAFDRIADRVAWVNLDDLAGKHYTLCLDGLFGMQFKPPLRGEAKTLLETVNENVRIDYRVAVDIPSGLGDEGAFRADFTYATGILKSILIEPENRSKCGRIRYLDIGFFPDGLAEGSWKPPFLMTGQLLAGLKRIRKADIDKRKQGHLFVVAGSRQMPGALLMASRAAASGGVGLLTVFGPESRVPHLVGALPEAMWVPFPETPNGGLALEGRREILSKMDQADAVLFGPGMGRESETARLLDELLGEIRVPVILDADALQPGIVSAAANRPEGFGKVVITPHRGEFKRISGDTGPEEFTRKTGLIVVLKGPLTGVYHGSESYLCPFGGPVLARGGTGDLLAGLIGARLAGTGSDVVEATCEAVAWHGRAADEWARERGGVGVKTTDLLDYLPEGLFYA